jgi:hypothetical protein
MDQGQSMHKYKHHIRKKYKGIQIDLYQDKDATWFCFVPNRVHPKYRSPNFKLSAEAVKDGQQYIDQNS